MKKKKNNSPLFVAISDIHFSLSNLDLSSAALNAALKKAEELDIPLVIAGDLNDTKAILRAEVANRLIEILSKTRVPKYIMIGNHDLINEKGEEHCLNFLKHYATIIDEPQYIPSLRAMLIPYQNNIEILKSILSACTPGDLLVMHQGLQGANMGDYVIDKTSITPDFLKDFTCISGHYHRHQTIGTLTYIGSPFTMSFGEANDGEKGFLIVHKDGSFTREILNLRKHTIVEWYYIDDKPYFAKDSINREDLVWVKARGTSAQLDSLNKQIIVSNLGISNFKLDKIYTDKKGIENLPKQLTGEQILDRLIDENADNKQEAKTLKKLWREVV